MNKIFLDESTMIEDAFKLAVDIYESGFRPTFIVGLWRGGSTVGIYVQECLQALGVETDHISLRTSYQGQPDYQQMVENSANIRVHGTQYLLENLNADDKLLIVDDAFSSGSNIQAVLERLAKHLKRNMPKQIKVAALWQRNAEIAGENKPDYVLHKTEQWLVFPYELKGLSENEIRTHKPHVAKLIGLTDSQ